MRISKVKAKDQELVRLLRHSDGSAIVYCSTRKTVDELAPYLATELSDRPVFAYHAGMDSEARAQSQERFMQTGRSIAVATVAFGMGINKPDIRLVVHYNIPGTVEAYYQEAGRAGRDGLPAQCMLLFSYQDRVIQEFFIDKIGEERNGADPQIIDAQKERAREKLELMLRYAQTHRCRRQMILDYFGDESEVSGCQCDVCGAGANAASIPVTAVVSDEVTTLVRQLLSGVARLHGKFGIGVVAEVLTGSQNERSWRWGLDKLSVYGLLRAHSTKRVIAMLHRLVESGLARQKDPEGVRFRPVVELTAAGIAVMKGDHAPPAMLSDLAPKGRAASESRPQKNSMPTDIDVDVAPETLERFERLRAVRSELARDRQLPPYCICHDTTLKQIAHFAPDSLEGLEQIKGMGPHKVKMYGEKLLGAVKGET
jgi:ATP-dependent DNA helicase RecQ